MRGCRIWIFIAVILIAAVLAGCRGKVGEGRAADTDSGRSEEREKATDTGVTEIECKTVEIGRITGGDKEYNGKIALSFIDNTYQVWPTLDEEICITSEFCTVFTKSFPEADYAILEVAEVDNQYRIYENGFYRSFRINDYSEFGGARSILIGETVSWSGSTVIGVKFTGNDLKRAEGKLAFLLRVYDCDGNEITSYYHGISVCYVKNSTNIIICSDDKFEHAKRLMGK